MYYYQEDEYYGVDFIYEYNIFDPQNNKICTVYNSYEAKNLVNHLNREKEEKK